ncbi:MAG: hypothetical protein ACYTEO_17365 [Planctomycetota bacterium]
MKPEVRRCGAPDCVDAFIATRSGHKYCSSRCRSRAAKIRERRRKRFTAHSTTSAGEFLDNLTEFLCDTEGISTEDLREDLEAKGVNTDKALARVKAILAKHGITIQGNA